MSGYSGLWDGVYNTPYAGLSSAVGSNNNLSALARVFRRASYGRGNMRGVLNALIGAAAGGTATVTHKRVLAVGDPTRLSYGGLVTLETFNDVSRVTVAGDVTALQAAVTQQSRPTTYVTDASGNGGGGKLPR